MTGYIKKALADFYYVKTSEGIVECKPRGIFRKQKITPVAGDVVTLETENGGAVIADIAPRRNVFVRPPMANLDVLFLVASTTQPTPAPSCWIKLGHRGGSRASSPSSSAPKSDLAEAEFLRSAYEKSTPCPSSASTTPPARVWTTSGTGSMAVSAPSAATPAWANPPC